MKHNKYFYIFGFVLLIQSTHLISMVPAKAPAKAVVKAPAAGRSQTEGYLSTLGKTRSEAYAKVKKVLTAPAVDKWGRWDNNSPIVQIDPAAFAPFIDKAIAIERQNPGYYAFYHGSQKEGFLTHLLRTYIHQIEHGWTRDDFYMLRASDSFYKKSAKSAEDYMKQNMPNILFQFVPDQSSKHQNCQMAQKDDPKIGYKCTQFDLGGDWRNQLISTSPSFVAGVDDTSQELRTMSEQDKAAWESSFYYFAQGLSWSTVLSLYGRLVGELKKYSPDLFKDTPINISLRKYIAFKFSMVAELLFPHGEQKKEQKSPKIKKDPTFDLYADAGMMFQFLVPANIVDDVAYLSWANGILWQRKINNFEEGWDNSIGAYTKVSPILNRLQTSPQSLGRSINLLQTRLIYKDEKYFNDPTSPIKINLIHALPPALFKSIEDLLKAIARVVVENKQAVQKGAQKAWFDQTDIFNTVQAEEAKLAMLLASKADKDQQKAMNILYYLVAIGVDRNKGRQIAETYKKSFANTTELGKISEAILNIQ